MINSTLLVKQIQPTGSGMKYQTMVRFKVDWPFKNTPNTAHPVTPKLPSFRIFHRRRNGNTWWRFSPRPSDAIRSNSLAILSCRFHPLLEPMLTKTTTRALPYVHLGVYLSGKVPKTKLDARNTFETREKTQGKEQRHWYSRNHSSYDGRQTSAGWGSVRLHLCNHSSELYLVDWYKSPQNVIVS